MTTAAPACLSCKHYKGPSKTEAFGLFCDAFRDAPIPDDIIHALNDHTKPVKGDHGIRFEPK